MRLKKRKNSGLHIFIYLFKVTAESVHLILELLRAADGETVLQNIDTHAAVPA